MRSKFQQNKRILSILFTRFSENNKKFIFLSRFRCEMIGQQAKRLAVYYQLLGIAPDASIEEIKIAFVEKARPLHESKKTSEESKMMFEKLKQAYYYIMDVKTGKIPLEKPIKSLDTGFELEHYQARVFPYKNRKEKYKIYNKPTEKEESDIQDVIIVLAYVSILVTFLMWFVWPVIVEKTIRKNVISVTLVMILFTSPLIIMPWRSLKNKPKEKKQKALHRLTKSVFLYLILGSVIMIWGFANYVSCVFLTPFELFLSFFLPFLLFFFLLPSVKSKFLNISRLISFVVWPVVFNLFFAINLRYSQPLRIENVKFELRNSSDIKVPFENKKHQSYPHIRTFFFEHMLLDDYQFLELHISKGCFGIQVLKSYRFIDEPSNENTQD